MGSSYNKAVFLFNHRNVSKEKTYEQPAKITLVGNDPRVIDKIKVNGRGVVGGDRAVELSPEATLKINDSNDYHQSGILYEQICWMLEQLGVENGTHDLLCRSVPLDMLYNETLVKFISSQLTFKWTCSDGEERSVEFKKVNVEAQGISSQAFWETLLKSDEEEDPEFVLNIDSGSHTTDVSHLKWSDSVGHYTVIPTLSRSLRGDFSMSGYINHLAKLIWHRNKDIVLDYYDLSEKIMNGKTILRDGNHKVDISDEILKTDNWLLEIAQSELAQFEKPMRKSDKIVLSGGTIDRLPMEIFYKDKAVYLDCFANARGQIILAFEKDDSLDFVVPKRWHPNYIEGASVEKEASDTQEAKVDEAGV